MRNSSSDEKTIGFDVLLQHEHLRSEVLSYMVDRDDDPIELLKNFAERIRVLIGCDQVIYRDLEETRIMVNSPAIEQSWSVPMEYCLQCQHFNAHHPMYSGGYTEMDNCQEGWQGIPVYSKCPIKSSLTRIVYCDGEIAGYLAIHYVQDYHHFTDVERKTLEEFTRILSISLSRYEARKENRELKLQKSLDESRTIIDSFTEAFGVVFKVNLSDASFSELKFPDGMPGKNIRFDNFIQARDFFLSSIVYEYERASMKREMDFATIRRKLENTSRYSFEFRNFIDGELSWNEMVVSSLGNDSDDVIIGFARRDEEILYRRIQEKINEDYFALYAVDLDLEVIRVAKPYPRYYVGDPDTDVPYVPAILKFASSLEGEARDFFFQLTDVNYVKQTLRYEDKHTYFFKTGQSEGGKWVTVTSYVILRHDDGIPAVFTLGFSYMDSLGVDRQEMKQKLQEALLVAQSASRAKTTFLNNVSHDIRTPMNAIIGYTGLAVSHLDDKELVRDYLSKISQSSDHLLSLINDVLDMSRIESGKMNLDEKEENLMDIIHVLKDLVQGDVRTKQLDFFVDAVDVKNTEIICDRLRLNQVLLNVLSNAVKFTPKGGTVSLRVIEKHISKSGIGIYEFRIKDNGMGMDRQFLETIFDPFTRVKSSTVSGIQGTGLGMAISKNIIDMMGGTIDIKSEPDRGTEVTMTFEFKLVHAPKAQETSLEFSGLQGSRILLVEDNELNLEIAEAILGEFGCEVTSVTDGTVAVEKMKSASPDDFDIILMDVQMPILDGYEATRQIRALGTEVSKIPIIAMTANAFEEDRKAAIEAGMNAHIGKPIDIEKLKETLARFLTSRA